uniref:DDE-1 domain-containing protein n=1 Tax=Ditylenchus dipsaci TaxID=166011 RepID=A0A915DYL4_9BILA
MYMCHRLYLISYDIIYACDKTAGFEEVSVLTTDHEKLRVTVMLTGRHYGYKFQPYVLLPRKRVDPTIVDKFEGKLQLAWKGTNWINDDLTNDFLMRLMG